MTAPAEADLARQLRELRAELDRLRATNGAAIVVNDDGVFYIVKNGVRQAVPDRIARVLSAAMKAK